jgi:hypothetical protein
MGAILAPAVRSHLIQIRRGSMLTAAQLQTFIDWIKTGPAYSLSGRFGRGPENDLITDHIGFLRYYGPHWAPTGLKGPGLRLIPADFLGVLAASDGSQVVVALGATDPVSMGVQFIGGAHDGLSVDSKMTGRPMIFAGGEGAPDIWMYFTEGSHSYVLQIVKEPYSPSILARQDAQRVINRSDRLMP